MLERGLLYLPHEDLPEVQRKTEEGERRRTKEKGDWATERNCRNLRVAAMVDAMTTLDGKTTSVTALAAHQRIVRRLFNRLHRPSLKLYLRLLLQHPQHPRRYPDNSSTRKTKPS